MEPYKITNTFNLIFFTLQVFTLILLLFKSFSEIVLGNFLTTKHSCTMHILGIYYIIMEYVYS